MRNLSPKCGQDSILCLHSCHENERPVLLRCYVHTLCVCVFCCCEFVYMESAIFDENV